MSLTHLEALGPPMLFFAPIFCGWTKIKHNSVFSQHTIYMVTLVKI